MKRFIEKQLSEILGRLYGSGQIEVMPPVEVLKPESAFGDYSTNIALRLSKVLKTSPKILAESFINQLKLLDTHGDFLDISEAGGFINFKLSKKALLENLSEIGNKKDRYGASGGLDQTVIVEYFQNNVAKPPHVGHLRSAVVGDSLLRIFRFLGYKAISDTHIGDWGVQFGILIYAFKINGDRSAIEKDPINELNKLYVDISEKIETDPDLREKGKQEFKKLEDGDAENRKLWQWFVDESLKDFERYRNLLGLMPFDNNLGESFYEDKMPAVLEDFKAKKLVEIGETGELYVELEEFGLGRCILVKSDGATTYHLRDFATYIYRKQEFGFYKNLYVVDNRQSHHFLQLFKVLELAGFDPQSDSAHVDLGFMSLPEGPISTRKGNIISLQALINEAEFRAVAIINEKNPDLKDKDKVASQVARAAIKYFDLSHNRKTEFTFTWDNALSFDGNTGPYLQYTHARIHGILRKAQDASIKYNADSITPDELETAVLRKLYEFPEILTEVIRDSLPNLLCNYLFELAQSFNSFYQSIPVLAETDENVKNFRMELITATAQTINNGLGLLGIDAPQEM
jgi:arginyl-tRNA synthetase